MTLQFESNTVASTLTALAPLDAPLAPTVQPPSPSQITANTTNARLVDWNAHHPDGSDQTIQELLTIIASRLNAEIYFARALPNGDSGTIFSSQFETHQPSEVSSGLKSSVVEACFATGRFLIASEKDATSGVLENYRRSEKFHFAVGFSVPDLRGPTEMSSGVVIGFREALPGNLDLSKYLTQLRLELVGWTQGWQACRDRRTPSFGSRIARSIRRHRTSIVAIGVFTSCLLTFVPVPYWPQRECVVEPSARRFVSSPIDGRVLKSLVRPGDVVEIGQVI